MGKCFVNFLNILAHFLIFFLLLPLFRNSLISLTSSGMNSVSEASYAGAPLIVIPLFADQHRNAKLVEYRELGLSLNSQQLNANNIAEAIGKIVENKR